MILAKPINSYLHSQSEVTQNFRM